jgi:hypothetical protein
MIQIKKSLLQLFGKELNFQRTTFIYLHIIHVKLIFIKQVEKTDNLLSMDYSITLNIGNFVDET